MNTLAQGGNCPLDAALVNVVLEWPVTNGTVDASAYLLADNGKVRGDADMIFYNQPEHGSGAVKITSLDPGRNSFSIDLRRLPADVCRLVFCLTVETPGRTLAAFHGARALVSGDGRELASFQPQLAGAQEAAIMIIELYRRGDVWKLRAVAQGFNGGLAPLATHFGMDVEEGPEAPASASPPGASPPPVAAPAPAIASASSRAAAPVDESSPPPPATISLVKIILDDDRPATIIEREGSRGLGLISVSLNWTSKWGGGQFGRPRPIDIRLGSLFELQDGRRGAVQALGNVPGQLDRPPYIALDRSDRTGEGSGRETLRINGDRWDNIKRIALFAFIHDGAPHWRASNCLVTIAVPNQLPIEFAMAQGRDGFGLSGLALLENREGALQVTRTSDFHVSHSEYDEQLKLGLTWSTSAKAA